MNERLFEGAFPYQKDILALPVEDINVAALWYCKTFGMSEVQRLDNPNPTVLLDRDGIRIGFSVNGGDASQDGAAILVSDIHKAKSELVANGVVVADIQVDERDGKKFQAFFVVAPDGLCYYFHQLIS